MNIIEKDTKGARAGRVAAASALRSAYPVVPFTGGLLVFIYAWFWPESYGHWLGTIVRSFRMAAGF